MPVITPIDPKLSILTFPQKLNSTTLYLNVLIIPRNIDPTQPLTTGLGGGVPDAAAFQTAFLSLNAKVITGLSTYPTDNVASTSHRLAGIGIPSTAKSIFAALQVPPYFDISKTGDKIPDVNPAHYLKKHLPKSYRQAFNFTNPRVPDARIDDSYECAVRQAEFNHAFPKPNDSVSWGEVYAHLLRQPDLARGVGFLQSTSIEITNDLFKNGGWLYVDLAEDSDFYLQQQSNSSIIRRYAARIPALSITKSRNVFAAIQFPVLDPVSDPLMIPHGNFDDIMKEASEYDTGFAKIVHTYQPVNGNILKEEEDRESMPHKDLGIRIGWDDEQILIWQNRQMKGFPNEAVDTKRADAPLGVNKYRIDVRDAVDAGQPFKPWKSLAAVKAVSQLMLGDIPIVSSNDGRLELGTEVYPSQMGGDQNSSFWLPSYFAQWIGKSLVLQDQDAISLYSTDAAGVKVEKTYTQDHDDDIGLYYGNTYEFRVRFADFSGGGPTKLDTPETETDIDGNPIDQGPAPISKIMFRRFIPPQPVIWADVPINGVPFTGTSLKINRPRLGYPAVVFTNKYPNVIDLLQSDADTAKSIKGATKETSKVGRDFGLDDPDVDQVEIKVEVRSLLMDNQLSANGRESYIELYTTHRQFPTAFKSQLEVPITFNDVPVLALGDPHDTGALGFSSTLVDGHSPIVLPTARDLRITMSGYSTRDLTYFGGTQTHLGLPVTFMMRQESASEEHLFSADETGKMIQGIYLQPDPEPTVFNSNTLLNMLIGDQNILTNVPDVIQRLAGEISIENKGYTLVGKPGQQVQFGCSRSIRHSMSPDNANLTISTKSDLINHWIVVITLDLKRDWAWDALKPDSFTVTRKMWFKADQASSPPAAEIVGYIRLGNAANIIALNNPDRSHTKLIFLDAVEPKPYDGKFPDMLELVYEVTPNLRDTNTSFNAFKQLTLELPVTTNPHQIPVLASAGVALTPYNASAKYSYTEAREKYLWLEFKEPPADPNDSFFIRLLNYAPDPLLADLSPDLVLNTVEPPIPLDPELIRVVSDSPFVDDSAGLDAMQEMIHSENSTKHFLIPLPPGLHSASPELFGMFTYEIRAGHNKIPSTAQGRYGRPLRTTGVQHPAPTLFCSLSRNEFRLTVSASHAVALLNGVNVTASPVRTELRALLYAQVIQADGASYRNILLDEKRLRYRVESPHEGNLLPGQAVVNSDAKVYSWCFWRNQDIDKILYYLGLPVTSSLSVICVEMMPRPSTYIQNLPDQQTSIAIPVAVTGAGTEAATATGTTQISPSLSKQLAQSSFLVGSRSESKIAAGTFMSNLTNQSKVRPEIPIEPGDKGEYSNEQPDPLESSLGEGLGKYRILRTSPLTAVPYIC